MERWPNFFIVGAPKAGTTSLYHYLSQAPEIYMSSVKEPNYFSVSVLDNNHELNPIRDKTKYLNLFAGIKDEKIIGEASTYYLSDPDAPELIHNVSPNAKILISLRDPVEREHSHFLMEERFLKTSNSFHDELKIELRNYKNSKMEYALKHGLYSDNVNRYLDIFGKDKVKILIFEDWTKNIEKTIAEILNFLGITTQINFNDMPYNEYKKIGKISKQILKSKTIRKIAKATLTKSRTDYLRNKLYRKGKKPKIDEMDRKILIDFYKDDVRKLESLLGQKLPWKNFTIVI